MSFIDSSQRNTTKFVLTNFTSRSIVKRLCVIDTSGGNTSDTSVSNSSVCNNFLTNSYITMVGCSNTNTFKCSKISRVNNLNICSRITVVISRQGCNGNITINTINYNSVVESVHTVSTVSYFKVKSIIS